MKREFSNAAAWLAGATWIEQSIGALVFLIIARIIGVETFGLASIAFAFLFVGEILVRDTLTEAIVERPELEDGRLEATFFILTGFSAAITATLWVAAEVIDYIYDNQGVGPILRTASPVVFLIGLSGVSNALIRRRMMFKALSIRTVLGVMVGGIVGITIALQGFGAWALVGQRLSEIGTVSILAIANARWWPKRGPRRGDWQLVRGLGPEVVQLRIWTLAAAQAPVVLLGAFVDARAAGIFAFSARLVEINLKVSVRVIQGVAQAAMANLRRQTGRTAEFFLELAELAAFAGFLSFTGIAAIAFPLVIVLLGPDWATAGVVIPLLAIAGAAQSLTAVQEAYLLATNQMGSFMRVIRAEAIVGFLVLLAVSPFGVVPSAVAVAIRAFVFLPLCTRATLAPDQIASADFIRALRSPAIVASIMGLVLLAWRIAMLGRMPDVIYLAAAILLGVATAAVVITIFMPQTFARLKTYVHDH